MRRLTLISFFMFFVASVRGNSVADTIYINRGTFITVNQSTFPALSYNSTSIFEANSTVFQLTTSDTLQLTIINNDTASHGFRVNDLNQQITIASGDTGFISLHFSEQGAYLYNDPVNVSNNSYLGLTGIIAVDNSNSKKYFWNIREHQKLYNENIVQGILVDWSQYQPDYFTINGKSFPDLQEDSTAVINAEVGDTIHIFMVNTGRSKHSIHFHGFHEISIFNDAGIITAASKDTWPLKSMQAVVLELIPDKQGRYSVHDHNLVAISGGGTHPNGMFLIMTINP